MLRETLSRRYAPNLPRKRGRCCARCSSSCTAESRDATQSGGGNDEITRRSACVSCRHPGARPAGRDRQRDRRRHRAGPVRADRRAVQARRERHAHAHRRGQRRRRRARPQAAPRGRGPRLRSQEGGAGGAEAGAAGPDLRGARLDRHADRGRRDADLSRPQGRASLPAHRRARDVRAAAPAEVFVLGAVLRPDPRRDEARDQGQEPRPRSARSTRTTISASR